MNNHLTKAGQQQVSQTQRVLVKSFPNTTSLVYLPFDH